MNYTSRCRGCGAINRIPAKNENRSNMHVGGKPLKLH